jgi:hypothetical protein
VTTGQQFIEQTLEQELGCLTPQIAKFLEIWQRASAALRSGDINEQNRALDEIILLREKKW